MIARYHGGAKGIAEYLRTGRKTGREETRDQLDERLVLDGDLGNTDKIIRGMKTHGERYLHITLSFGEDYIPPQTLRAINEDFRSFLMSAHQEDEYTWYAEAHLPRIQNYRDSRTGALVERLTHIHVVIPETNLLTGGRLCPTGLVKRNDEYLDAIQELINQKYGLASPKDEDRRRAVMPGKHTFISRTKGDEFRVPQAGIRKQILDEIIARDICSTKELVSALEAMGEVRVRNAGKVGEYLNLKTTGAAKGINLKGAIYQQEFLKLPKDEKLKFAAGIKLGRGTNLQPKRSREELEALVLEWQEIRCLEIKHIKVDTRRKSFREYDALTQNEKREHLARKEREFQLRYQGKELVTPPIEPSMSQQLKALSVLGQDLSKPKKPANSTAEQASIESERRKAEERNAYLSEWQLIKRDLDPERLLKKLEASHGIDLKKYKVTAGTDGMPRINAGGRNHNVSDFLTKELHLSWQQASGILRETYKQQIGQQPIPKRAEDRPDYWSEFIAGRIAHGKAERSKAWLDQRDRERQRLESIGDLYFLKRQQIRQSNVLGKSERELALKLMQADRVKDEMNASRLTAGERAALRESQKVPLQQQYCAFLERKQILLDQALRAEAEKAAETGKLEALRKAQAPLARENDRARAREARERKRLAEQEFQGARAARPQKRPAVIRQFEFDAKVEIDKSVTYSRHGKAMFRDAGNVVYALARDEVSMEAFVRLSQLKYGNRLQFFGSDDFVRQSIQTAVDKGIRLELAEASQAETYRRALNLRSVDERSKSPEVAKLQIVEQDRPRPKVDNEPDYGRGR